MNDGAVTIRVLTETDAQAFRRLRLEALELEPQAFLSSAEDERTRPLEEVAVRLKLIAGERFTLGALKDGRLVGMVGFGREARRKIRHKGNVWGMYVSEVARGQGVGRALLTELIEQAKVIPGLEQINLTVTSEQAAAKGLYRALGFEVYGLERRALKLEGRYYDEELMVLWLV